MLFISGLKDDAPHISQAQSLFYYLLNLDSCGFLAWLKTNKFRATKKCRELPWPMFGAHASSLEKFDVLVLPG